MLRATSKREDRSTTGPTRAAQHSRAAEHAQHSRAAEHAQHSRAAEHAGPLSTALALFFLCACSEHTIFAVRDLPDARNTGSGASGSAGNADTSGGASGSGNAGNGGASGSGNAGSAGNGGASGGGGTTGDDGGICTPSIRIREIDVGLSIVANENEAALMLLAIAPLSQGGSRLAFMDASSTLHVVTLDADDQLTGAGITLPAHDFADLYADDQGGAVLLTRAANGGGTGNCGTLTNLCGATLPSAETCYDAYLVRFDGTNETWAAKLTDATRALPPYSTSPTGPNVVFVWSAYAHHGRIAFDGSRYAAYFGTALSSSEDCTSGGTNGKGVNIYQGDRMKVVGADGTLQTGGFDFGCSTSGYERVVYDPSAKKFVAICKNGNRIAIAPPSSGSAIYNFDAYYGNVGNLVLGPSGGYWLTASNLQTGQPANANGLADVHLLHFSSGTADTDLLVSSNATSNERAPHLARFGASRLLVAWESSPLAGDLQTTDRDRKLFVQAWNATSGTPEGLVANVAGVVGNRYQEFRGYADGSVAYPAPGSASTTIKIVRVLPCAP